MNRAKDVVFAVLVSAVLFLVLGNIALSVVADDYDIPQKSYLEGRSYKKIAALMEESIQDGRFQGSFEQYVADRFPNRDWVLLQNAGMQRRLIEQANIPFNFPVYPTFLDSKYLIWRDQNALVELPSSKRIETEEIVDGAIMSYATLMGKFPDINWAFALAERSRISNNNIAHSFVSQPADYDYYFDHLRAGLPISCKLISLEYADPEEYFKHFFRTDHHQQIVGGMNSYSKIIQAFGRTPIQFEGIYIGTSELFYGSGIRESLLGSGLFSDLVYDVAYKHGQYKVVVNGSGRSADLLSHGLSQNGKGYEKKDTYSNVYAEYFHTDFGLIEIENEAAEEGALLIIGDSFTDNMDYFFAENYRHVYILDPRYYEGTVKEFIDNHQIDDAVFLMASNTMIDKSVLKKMAIW